MSNADNGLVDLLRENKELWELYTRREEYEPERLDEHGRFASYMSRNGGVGEPKVSKFLLDKGMRVEYPGGEEFAVCLTHDIDLLKPHSVRNLRIPRLARMGLGAVSTKFRAAWGFRQIIELERDFGAKSTFFFMAVDRTDEDFNYGIIELEDDVRGILDDGWDVGLHGGRGACSSIDQLRNEKSRLEKVTGRKVTGYRNHYMRLNVPLTWRILVEAGFEYDSTLGYADVVGFRNGMCHPFRPFDLESKKHLDLLEFPLVVMDTTLYSYLQLDTARAWEATKDMIDRVAATRGVFTLLWHNTYMSGDRLALYRKIMEYCHSRGAWMTSAEEICRWWHSHDFFGTG